MSSLYTLCIILYNAVQNSTASMTVKNLLSVNCSSYFEETENEESLHSLLKNIFVRETQTEGKVWNLNCKNSNCPLSLSDKFLSKIER